MQSSLTPDQIRLIQTSWSQVVPLAYTFSGEFYERLFTLDPSARELFAPRNFGEQRGKFIQMLSLIVRDLSYPERLHAEVLDLARRHAHYGVRAEQYETMANALLWTLERALGSAFTPPTREAWASAYASWTAVMRASDPHSAPLTRPTDLPDPVSSGPTS